MIVYMPTLREHQRTPSYRSRLISMGGTLQRRTAASPATTRPQRLQNTFNGGGLSRTRPQGKGQVLLIEAVKKQMLVLEQDQLMLLIIMKAFIVCHGMLHGHLMLPFINKRLMPLLVLDQCQAISAAASIRSPRHRTLTRWIHFRRQQQTFVNSEIFKARQH